METIAEILKISFQPQLAEMVSSIVNGVLEGLQSAVASQKMKPDNCERKIMS